MTGFNNHAASIHGGLSLGDVQLGEDVTKGYCQTPSGQDYEECFNFENEVSSFSPALPQEGVYDYEYATVPKFGPSQLVYNWVGEQNAACTGGPPYCGTLAQIGMLQDDLPQSLRSPAVARVAEIKIERRSGR